VRAQDVELSFAMCGRVLSVCKCRSGRRK
jgi:hypothetical protein